MAKRKLLKNTNDFIIGMVLLILGIYVVFSKDIIHGNIPIHTGGILIRPDVYVRIIGGFLAFFALIITIKAINFFGTSDTKGFRFVLTREVVLTIAALIIYTVLLSLIGFFISTFLLIFFLACMYLRREKTGPDRPPLTRKEIIRDLIIIFVYTTLLVLFVYFIFTRVLYVALP